MNIQHKELAVGRWQTFSFLDQMANIGGEIERALRWKEKGNQEYSRAALERGLELVDFTIADARNHCGGRLVELTRARELLVDFFLYNNEYSSTPSSWHNYFMPFCTAAAKNR